LAALNQSAGRKIGEAPGIVKPAMQVWDWSREPLSNTKLFCRYARKWPLYQAFTFFDGNDLVAG
jgi:hypothetical protein